MNTNKLCFRAYTHTLQTCSTVCPLPLPEINQKSYISRNAKHTARGVIFTLNANKYVGCDIDTLTTLLAALSDIQAELQVDEWRLDRLDIAIDTLSSFDELYKFNLMFAHLFRIHTNNNNDVVINGLSDNKKRAIVINHRKFELYIYDKLLESKGIHPYSRCEFRFKLLNINDVAVIIKRLEGVLTALPKYVEALNKEKIQFLYDEWQKEHAQSCNKRIKSFSEFVRRYDNHIFTREILKGIYCKVMSGNFEQWLYKFRKENFLVLISCNDMLRYCKGMKQAIRMYVK